MNELTHSAKQVALIKQTVASDCESAEFDLFMEAAKSYKLDPFRKQISTWVFNKNAKDKSRRRMSIVVSRDGLRVIAQRCGNYRPASEPAKFVYDKELQGPENPKGIVSVSVKLWQCDAKGNWFEVIGEADWDEFAPLKDEWTFDNEARKNKPTGKKTLEGNWSKMPKVMIQKCAEAQALRAGWPDQFSGLYVEEEMDRAKTLDLSASEIVAQEEEEDRLRLAQADNSITIFWGDGFALENVPLGQFMDRALEFIEQSEASDIIKWADMNRSSLKQFWAREPGDALALKERLESVKKQLAPEFDGPALEVTHG